MIQAIALILILFSLFWFTLAKLLGTGQIVQTLQNKMTPWSPSFARSQAEVKVNESVVTETSKKKNAPRKTAV